MRALIGADLEFPAPDRASAIGIKTGSLGDLIWFSVSVIQIRPVSSLVQPQAA